MVLVVKVGENFLIYAEFSNCFHDEYSLLSELVPHGVGLIWNMGC